MSTWPWPHFHWSSIMLKVFVMTLVSTKDFIIAVKQARTNPFLNNVPVKDQVSYFHYLASVFFCIFVCLILQKYWPLAKVIAEVSSWKIVSKDLACQPTWLVKNNIQDKMQVLSIILNIFVNKEHLTTAKWFRLFWFTYCPDISIAVEGAIALIILFKGVIALIILFKGVVALIILFKGVFAFIILFQGVIALIILFKEVVALKWSAIQDQQNKVFSHEYIIVQNVRECPLLKMHLQ